MNKGLDELCEECKSRHMLIDQISTLYNQIVSLFYKYYSNSDANYEIEYLNYYQIVRHYSSIEQLFERIKAIFEQQAGEELHISNETVKKIIDIYRYQLYGGYYARLFVKEVQYQSRIFKRPDQEGNGKNVYGVCDRTKDCSLAKELLNDSSLSIHEIVERVGYKDYFHFNKLFKKHFGHHAQQISQNVNAI